MENKIILKRLYNDYTKKFLPKILLSVFFSLIVAGSTAAIAWLLDPAIKKIFIDKDEKLILIIPVAIILAFSLKGGSLYFAKTILIRTAQEITKIIQMQVMRSLITADTDVIDKKHTPVSSYLI
jgi:subfamily B ATP-binding cassette protein MsbA